MNPPGRKRAAGVDLKELYNEKYFDIYRADLGTSQQKKRTLMYEQEYKRIERYCRGGNILDVGCGLGDFLAIFPPGRWNRFGIEISEYASREAEQKGINMKIPENPPGFFDLVVFRGTLQHLDEPLATIKKSISWLKPGGHMVFLATPNTGGLCYRLFQEHPALDPRYNFMLVSDKILRQILENLGMEIVGLEFPYLNTPYAHPVRDVTRFVMRCLGVRKPFAFWGNMLECYSRKPEGGV
jgi:SAM-dependent methyltransferase